MDNTNLPELTSARDNQFDYLQKLSKSSNAFYNFILFIIVAIIFSLPFISVGITTSSPASIQTNNHQENLYSPLGGKISLLRIDNNHHVSKGDTLVMLDNSQVKNEVALTENRKIIIGQSIHDIKILKNSLAGVNRNLLYTTQYQSQYTHYIEQKALLSARFNNANKTYQRFANLYSQKVISASEYEKYELDYRQAISDLKILETNTQSQWQTERFALRQELNNIKVKESQLKDLMIKSAVIANISGTGYNTEGIQVGTFVQGGQKIAEIIPDNNLIAICLVSPKDIGYIKENQKVRLQIDAYNYYDWGTINGFVSEIIKDVSIVDNKPFYIVHCRINKTYLTLKNGYKGNLIKGMTGRANFNLTTRTLWQLLFTNVNEWLNPKQN